MGSQLIRAFVMFAIVLVADRATAAAAGAHKHGGDEKPVAGVISLDVCADGDHMHLLTAARADGQSPRLSYQSSSDGGATWSSPVELGAGQPPTIAKRGMDAQIAAAGKNLIAVWPTAGSDKMGRGPMATALSNDGGRTWRAGPNPADDNLTIGHSFIDVVGDARAGGRFHVVWLDSREGTTKGLRYARSDDGGATWSRNLTLDPDTCECCWNTIATTAAGGVAVLYRDANPRDMAVVRSDDGGERWTTPTPVGRFNWDITACPHVGGALALSAGAAHALVWVAKDKQTHGVYALNATGDLENFATPQRLGPHSASRPDLCLTDDNRLIAAWDADAVDDAAPTQLRGIYTCTSTDAGRTWSTPCRVSDPARTATHARLLRTRSGGRVFWTETPPGGATSWSSSGVGE